jgi:hypothetical protein
MDTRPLFNTSAVIEILTGAAFLGAPMFLLGLLLGDGAGPTGIAVARVTGIGLLSLGVASWEPSGLGVRLTTRIGLCTYNIGVAVLLTMLGADGAMSGLILWPVMAMHAVIGAMMLWIILAAPNDGLILNIGESQ